MKDTLIPLSVAFLDKGGKVLQIEDMAARTTNQHCANAPAMYALELNGGRYSELGILPGDKITGGPEW